MRSLTAKRKGLLQLLIDYAGDHGDWVYLTNAGSSVLLFRYGLSVYDFGSVTWAIKAGHVEAKQNGSGFYRITYAGREAMKSVKFTVLPENAYHEWLCRNNEDE
jgi:hypothetical protein